jgi:hypothetical protein
MRVSALDFSTALRYARSDKARELVSHSAAKPI